MRHWTRVVLLWFCTIICSSLCGCQEERILQERPIRIVASAAPSIFPRAWRSQDIDATAKPLRTREFKRSQLILNKAMAKYPSRVLTDNITTVYVVHTLCYCGITASGTNSWSDIYIANQGPARGFTDQWVEDTFHEEFSSILLRNFPRYLDKAAWTGANLEKNFKYGDGGVDFVKEGRIGKEFQTKLHKEGFLCDYAKSSIENDFNAFAGQLFMGDLHFWTALKKHPRIKKKADLTIAFYHRLNPKFTETFFRSLVKNPKDL